MTTITIPKDVVRVDHALVEILCRQSNIPTESLKHVEFSDSVKEIGARAFAEFTNLESINFPPSLETIEEWAFSECKGLQAVRFPSSVGTIGEYAFCECTSLKKVVFENPETPDWHNSPTPAFPSSNVANLKKGVFAGCIELADIQFPACLLAIDEYAFQRCTALRSVVIPVMVSHIKEGAFDQCTNLEVAAVQNEDCYMGATSFPSSTHVVKGY